MELEINGMKMFYKICGEGHPIVLIHGNPLDHRAMVGAFEPIFESRPGWQRIYIDLPGMGQSSAPDWIAGSDQMLDVVVELVDRLLPDQPFSIVGFSYGGYIARGLLYRKFYSVDGLMLLTPRVSSSINKQNFPEQLILVRDDEAMAIVPPETRPIIEATMVVQDQDMLERVRDEIGVGMMLGNQDFLSRIREQYDYTFDVDDLPETFRKPALIVVGRHDAVVGYWEAANLVPKYPRSTYAVLDRAGHGVHFEQEHLFNQLVYEWLDRVKEMLPQTEAITSASMT